MIRGLEGRVSVREQVTGTITDVDTDPEPAAVNRNDDELTVLWELDTKFHLRPYYSDKDETDGLYLYAGAKPPPSTSAGRPTLVGSTSE